MLRWGNAWSTLGNCATLGGGDAWSTLGNCATLGGGGRLAHAGELCYARGDAWSTLGNCVTLGGRLVHAGELCYAGGCLVHAGELCYAGGTPGPRWGTVLRWGDAWSTLGKRLAVSVRFSDAGVSEDLFSLSSAIEVKYASRGPPYIAGSELLSRVS